MTLRDRFLAKIQILPSGCWLWTSATSNGTPVFSVPPSKAISGLRIAWEIEYGVAAPKRKRAARLCSERLCVNPRHWWFPTLEERFWRFVDKGAECWAWNGTRGNGGYGMFKGTKTGLAHRMSYTLANGPIPIGLDVLHRCDNPPCVNPAHLFLGTNSDNQQDCIAKGRHAPPPTQKLTADIVRGIRRSRASAKDLAAIHGVTRSTIYDIRNRQTWRNA